MAHHDVAGALLVGGASTRFGSTKALASFQGETLAERSYRTLEEAFDHVFAVGKAADNLPLPFPVLDDGSEERAAAIGVAAALRLGESEVCVVVPTDMPFLTSGFLRSLASAVQGVDVAHPATGPLPGAYRRTALPALERGIAAGELSLRRIIEELRSQVVDADHVLLRNVNTPDDLVA
jgi:molybdenum cofactor guanylyltransferase